MLFELCVADHQGGDLLVEFNDFLLLLHQAVLEFVDAFVFFVGFEDGRAFEVE